MVTQKYKEKKLKQLSLIEKNLLNRVNSEMNNLKVLLNKYKTPIDATKSIKFLKGLRSICSNFPNEYMISHTVNKTNELKLLKVHKEYEYEEYYILKKGEKISLVKRGFSRYYNVNILKWGSKVLILDPKISRKINSVNMYHEDIYTKKDFDLIVPAKECFTEDQLNNIKSLKKDKTNREILKLLVNNLDL